MTNSKRVICGLLIVTIVSVQVISSLAMYMPNNNRRQDDSSGDEDDEMDQGASAPYQNNNQGGSEGANENYGDADPDGPYDETPREEENQADLERFFEDHLGASDKDGMDKENLPSEVVETSLPAPEVAPQASEASPTREVFHAPSIEIRDWSHERQFTNYQGIQPSRPVPAPTLTPEDLDDADDNSADDATTSDNDIDSTNTRNDTTNDKADQPHPNGESRIITTEDQSNPNKRLARHSEAEADPEASVWNKLLYGDPNDDSPEQSSNNLGVERGAETAPNESAIVATENDDQEPVYVTNDPERPFRIDELGGFDPEEDFERATEDIEGSDNQPPEDLQQRQRQRLRGPRAVAQRAAQVSVVEPETLVKGASEADEILFPIDEPYATDLEEEMRAQSYDRPQTAASDEALEAHLNDDEQYDTTGGRQGLLKHRRGPQRHSRRHLQRRPQRRSDSYRDREDRTDSRDPQENDEIDDNEEAKTHQRRQRPRSRSRSRYATGRRPRPAESRAEPREDRDDDLDEGRWINDGVDDMDVPSPQEQDRAIKKTMLKQRLAKLEAREAADYQRQAPDDAPATNEDDSGDSVGDNSGDSVDSGDSGDGGQEQRMPNADYMQKDLAEF